MIKQLYFLVFTVVFAGLVYAGVGGEGIPQQDSKGKYIVCHKGKTLHVGSLDARNDHLDHGDTDGPCG